MNKKVNVNEFIKKHNLKPAFVVAPDKTEKFLEEMANPTITAEDVIKRTEEKLKILKERARRKEMTKEKILEKLASIDKEKFGILELGLFGSYAKGRV